MWSIEEAKRLKSQHEHGWNVTESAEILERSELDIRNKLLSMGLKPIEDGEKPAKATIARILKQDGKTNAEHKKAGNNGLAGKYAELEKVVNNQSAIINGKNEEIINANLEISMLKNKIKALESDRAEKAIEPADNWSVRELKNVLEPLKAIRTENGLDVLWKTIGQTIGRLEMMISIAHEEERRHGF